MATRRSLIVRVDDRGKATLTGQHRIYAGLNRFGKQHGLTLFELDMRAVDSKKGLLPRLVVKATYLVPTR